MLILLIQSRNHFLAAPSLGLRVQNVQMTSARALHPVARTGETPFPPELWLPAQTDSSSCYRVHKKHNGGHVARTSGPAQTGTQRILVILDKQTEDETPAWRLLPHRGTSAVMQRRPSDVALPLSSAGVYKGDTSAWPVLLTRKDIWRLPINSWEQVVEEGHPLRQS